jgi:hypothetical protein
LLYYNIPTMIISNKKVVLSIPLLLAVVSASTVAVVVSATGHTILSAAYAATDKVKVNCNDLAVMLVALRFSANNLSPDERASVDSSLSEPDDNGNAVAPDLQSILDHNLVDLIHKAQQQCPNERDILDLAR